MSRLLPTRIDERVQLLHLRDERLVHPHLGARWLEVLRPGHELGALRPRLRRRRLPARAAVLPRDLARLPEPARDRVESLERLQVHAPVAERPDHALPEAALLGRERGGGGALLERGPELALKRAAAVLLALHRERARLGQLLRERAELVLRVPPL